MPGGVGQGTKYHMTLIAFRATCVSASRFAIPRSLNSPGDKKTSRFQATIRAMATSADSSTVPGIQPSCSQPIIRGTATSEDPSTMATRASVFFAPVRSRPLRSFPRRGRGR